MTKKEFEDLITEACILYVKECEKKENLKEIEEVKFSKRHQKMMKKLFRDVRKGKFIQCKSC